MAKKHNLLSRCKWPLDSVQQLFDPQTFRFGFTYGPVWNNVENVAQCMTEYYKRISSVYGGLLFTNKSCLRQLVEMDEYVRMNPEEPNYLLYPEIGKIQEYQ